MTLALTDQLREELVDGNNSEFLPFTEELLIYKWVVHNNDGRVAKKVKYQQQHHHQPQRQSSFTFSHQRADSTEEEQDPLSETVLILLLPPPPPCPSLVILSLSHLFPFYNFQCFSIQYCMKKSDVSVVSIISNCDARNHRNQYVRELSKWIPVDSYGNCLGNKVCLFLIFHLQSMVVQTIITFLL